MKNTSIILGYGVFTKPNPNYQKYLETVLDDIIKSKPDKIITCGGYSNPKYPSLSEAGSVKNLFLELHPELEKNIITENKSLSTPQNIEFTKEFVGSENIIIYCDSIRAPKVFYLSLFLYFPELSEKAKLTILEEIYISRDPDVSRRVVFSYQKLTVVGIPFSNTTELAAHQIISSMLEMHAFDYPDLHRQFVDYRQRKWKIK